MLLGGDNEGVTPPLVVVKVGWLMPARPGTWFLNALLLLIA
jgi:hypothetical protein